MKKVYVKPSVDMVSFQCEDIITASTPDAPVLKTSVGGVEATSVGTYSAGETYADFFK